MSKLLVEAIRKKREIRIEVDGKTFFAHRPTDLDMMALTRLSGAAQAARVLEFVFGWSGVTQDDVIGDATSDSVKFDADLFREWVSDRAKYMGPIIEKFFASYTAHAKAEQDAVKNSQPD